MENEIENMNIVKLADTIVREVNQSKQLIALNMNQTMVNTYWRIGCHIVEFEQNGNSKAEYGTAMLTKLSKVLTAKLGRGFSRPNLNSMRKFYILYKNCQMSDKLTWSHICEIIKIDDELERKFYENECAKENWNVRSLRRQMDSRKN